MRLRWYVVSTKSGQEIRAWVAIAELGFATFFPQLRRTISHARKRTEVLRPMYPSYLFARFDVKEQELWSPVLRTRGVANILGIIPGCETSAPKPVPFGVVEFLQGYVCGLDDAMPVGRREPLLSKGTAVQITDGPFAGWSGLVDEDERTRVKVLLDIMGKETPVSVPRYALSTVP